MVTSRCQSRRAAGGEVARRLTAVSGVLVQCAVLAALVGMAVRAWMMLLEEIEAPGSHPEPVIYSTELVERASTSVAPTASAANA